MWWNLLAAYGFATIGGALLVSPVVDALWKALGWHGAKDSSFRLSAWIPQLVGMLERVLYVTALHLGFGEFIGFWLALKVAGQWSRWGEMTQIDDRKLHGRAIYQVFLIGNSLSVMFGVVGYLMLGWFSTGNYRRAIEVTVAMVIADLILVLWIRLRTPGTKIGT